MPESSSEFPFRATVVPVGPSELPSDSTPDGSHDDEWSEQDLDDLYRQTLEAVDAATEDASRLFDEQILEDLVDTEAVQDVGDGDATDVGEAADECDAAESVRITARQVVEALMFVGGGPVTGKQMAELLGGESHEYVDELVESLNTMYLNQARPYEVRLVEGGYQLALRPEYDRVRNRVFGLGPREVKLSQDALELLALVAYQQPITKAEIDELGKPNASTILRQLLRRELLVLERDDEDAKTVAYRTTPRFLEVFGLKSLDDLPQVEDLMFR